MRGLLAISLLVLPLAAAPEFGRDARPILAKYCFSCHGEDKQEAGIEFHEMTSDEDAFRKHRLLEHIEQQVADDEMPPFEADEQPTEAERDQLLAAIRHLVGRVERGEVPKNPGRVTIRRLNRNEYNYTVRDLFGINFLPGRDFPADGAGGEGFDNTADALFLPPVLMEKYLAAADRVVAALYANQRLRQRILFVKPEDKVTPEDAARRILNYHGALAFRRRLTDDDLAPLVAAVTSGVAAGKSFEEAMQVPLKAILVHPRFLFRIQHDEQGRGEWPLDDFELAARLSYFLWSSMPDRELFQLADEGKLRDPEVLRAQVARMIKNPKSKSFARHFAGQWLGFDDLIDRIEPDKDRFPRFTRTLRAAMYRESEHFFDHLIRNNRPVTDLIHSDYTFLNAELARHYGIAGVTGAEMRKVPLTDPNRGGVIGMGSVLTATSLPLRTSPVKRGKWILESILGDPPPPPLPDAGELPADDKSPEGLSFRQRLEIHRRKPECASCHARIDPLGFGLENFDAIGRWRTHEVNGKPVDSSAVLPGDIAFSTPAELKELLMGAKDKVARNLCRKMLAYALGRSLEYYDEPVINGLLRVLQRHDYRIEPLIIAIAESYPFQNRGARR
ncbi:MAG: DUF1592 domain-containing protein [Akkermansiaceae bacterium]|nr:DUF1592 domain-containing protein [Akkermansiaceae bacterium]